MTPRSIHCPSCWAAIGKVCETYSDPDAASDLTPHVTLYCAERIDAVFEHLTSLFVELAEQTPEGKTILARLGKEIALP